MVLAARHRDFERTVQGRDVQKRRCEVTLQLPVSKVDPEAKGCSRTHCCICRPVQSSTCAASTSQALMFTPLQSCSCREGHERLCVFHALMNIVISLHKQQAFRPNAYLFGPGGRMPTTRQISTLAKCCAVTLGHGSLDEWHSGAVDRRAQHSFQVAGAQFLARSGLDVAVIQLLGRWGSNAIMRCVQTAALVPERTARTVARALNRHAGKEEDSTSCDNQIPATGNRDFQEMVRRLISECVKFKNTIVHNPRTRLGHKPSCDEGVTDSSCWTTACGRWWYGLSRCVRNDELLLGYRACRSCFGNHKCTESASVVAEDRRLRVPASCSSGQ